MTERQKAPVLPNPDIVLGIDFIEKPFTTDKQPRWESDEVQPKIKTDIELESEITGPQDLG